MAPSEVPSETETEDSVGKKPRARRLQDADRKALGEHVLSQEDLRTYVVGYLQTNNLTSSSVQK